MNARPRKALGQHFLSHPPLLAKIAAVTGAGSDHVVLEIGPGRGALTEAFLSRGATVVAIERDPRLHAALLRQFAGRDFALVAGDALALDWPALVTPWTSAGKSWLVAGNIPYNITSPLLTQALTAPLPASVTFLVQREVAERVVAPAGSEHYGGLSIGIQAVAHATRKFTVDKRAFTPPPKVDSALLQLVPREPPLVAPERIRDFRRLVTSLFSYRRKRMLRALREATGLDANAAEELLRLAGIDPDLRPENVAVAGFVRLLDLMPLTPAWRDPPPT
ncbi:MAG: 16S rRNA (adenine(1518)-N(6)/adenine(1519)-N(6))-dimethyltransferase RsmA [Gemmatimonadales bacterium]